jgi:hypothetical protein
MPLTPSFFAVLFALLPASLAQCDSANFFSALTLTISDGNSNFLTPAGGALSPPCTGTDFAFIKSVDVRTTDGSAVTVLTKATASQSDNTLSTTFSSTSPITCFVRDNLEDGFSTLNYAVEIVCTNPINGFCNVQAFTSGLCFFYYWRMGDWTSCSANCDGGTQSRTVSCAPQSQSPMCDSNLQPSTQQSCNTDGCGPSNPNSNCTLLTDVTETVQPVSGDYFRFAVYVLGGYLVLLLFISFILIRCWYTEPKSQLRLPKLMNYVNAVSEYVEKDGAKRNFCRYVLEQHDVLRTWYVKHELPDTLKFMYRYHLVSSLLFTMALSLTFASLNIETSTYACIGQDWTPVTITEETAGGKFKFDRLAFLVVTISGILWGVAMNKLAVACAVLGQKASGHFRWITLGSTLIIFGAAVYIKYRLGGNVYFMVYVTVMFTAKATQWLGTQNIFNLVAFVISYMLYNGWCDRCEKPDTCLVCSEKHTKIAGYHQMSDNLLIDTQTAAEPPSKGTMTLQPMLMAAPSNTIMVTTLAPQPQPVYVMQQQQPAMAFIVGPGPS